MESYKRPSPVLSVLRKVRPLFTHQHRVSNLVRLAHLLVPTTYSSEYYSSLPQTPIFGPYILYRQYIFLGGARAVQKSTGKNMGFSGKEEFARAYLGRRER